MDYRGYDNNFPLGIRCNNPLNISSDGWQGEIGVYPNAENEAIFSDTVYGLRAGALLLYNYYTGKGLNTIAGCVNGIVSRWAPAGDQAAINNPDAYANYVAQQTGIGVNQVFQLNAQNIKAIMQAMVKYEVGPGFAAMIPDNEYDQAIQLAGKIDLMNKIAGGGTIILLGFIAYLGYRYFK